jgi:hypothetical protein
LAPGRRCAVHGLRDIAEQILPGPVQGAAASDEDIVGAGARMVRGKQRRRGLETSPGTVADDRAAEPAGGSACTTTLEVA